jgi:AhpD family alkylhydroperoxidase
MSRVGTVPVPEWDAELRTAFAADQATPLEQGAMRMFAHRPAIAKGIIALGAGLKQDRTLSERLVELVRLRIAWHNQCRSCMAIRYRDAVADGVDEDLVCSLERPAEAPDLTPAERAALDYADRFATNHLSIDDAVLNGLRVHFSEGEIVELGCWVAFCVGFGRLGAVFDMVEELPAEYRAREAGLITPWSGTPIVVR